MHATLKFGEVQTTARLVCLFFWLFIHSFILGMEEGGNIRIQHFKTMGILKKVQREAHMQTEAQAGKDQPYTDGKRSLNP